MNSIENTIPWCRGVACFIVASLCHCIATGVIAEPFPSDGSLNGTKFQVAKVVLEYNVKFSFKNKQKTNSMV
jgi:hypothetical protein